MRWQRTRHAAEWLGLRSRRPKPTLRQSMRAWVSTLPWVVVAAVVAVAAQRLGAPHWFATGIMLLPMVVLGERLQRLGRDRPQPPPYR